MMNYLKKFSLQNKIAYVAGGAGLIGSEVSKALASAGASTIILDNDRKRGESLASEIQLAGHEARYERFDITHLEGLEQKLSEIARARGPADIWVNASYPRTQDWLTGMEKMRVKSLRANVDMHLNSSIWTSRIVALQMKKFKRPGSIINFGSIYGVQGNDFSIYSGTSLNSPMTYAAIKGGIINATRYLAAYFGKHHIRVNNVCPGGVLDHQPKRFIKNYEKKVPLQRMAKPEEIAAVVVFLASEASSYITGSTLMVDGGWTIV